MTALTGLMKIELPSGDIRLCDGGFFTYAAETYTNSDATFGTITGIEAITDGFGDSLPILKVVFAPPSDSAVADLVDSSQQGSRVRFWISEFDTATGLLTGSADMIFDGIIDRPVLSVSRDNREVEFDIISNAERLLLRQEANTQSPRFHKTIWAGELGQDNAVDLEITVSWGTETSRSSGTYTGVGGLSFWSLSDRQNMVFV